MTFPRLQRIVEQNDTAAGRAFDIVIQALIVVSLVSFSLETLPDLSERARAVLEGIEFATVVIFSAEYLLRVLVVERKLRFIFSFFGIIDILAILPFYLQTGVDLRSLRSLRMLRLFRIFKLVRYNRALRRFRRAFAIAKEELVLFLFLAGLLLFLSAVGIYYFEHEAQPEQFASVFHSLWWAVSTLTTVGYGDIYPLTLGGRIFTFLVLVVGLGIVAVPSGLVASALAKAREQETQSQP